MENKNLGFNISYQEFQTYKALIKEYLPSGINMKDQHILMMNYREMEYCNSKNIFNKIFRLLPSIEIKPNFNDEEISNWRKNYIEEFTKSAQKFEELDSDISRMEQKRGRLILKYGFTKSEKIIQTQLHNSVNFSLGSLKINIEDHLSLEILIDLFNSSLSKVNELIEIEDENDRKSNNNESIKTSSSDTNALKELFKKIAEDALLKANKGPNNETPK